MRRRLLAATSLSVLLAWAWSARTSPASGAAAVRAADWQGLRLPALDGGTRALHDGRGPQVVNLWARWCGPCRRELAALQRWAAALQARGVAVSTIALDDDAFALREYVRDLGLTLPVLLAASSALPPALRPDRLPQTVLLGADGREQRRVIGARDWDTAAAQRELLGEIAA